MSDKPRAIGAYIFAGGFSLGVRDHFDVACVLEETNYGVATARRNMPEIPVHVGGDRWPIEELKKQEWDFIYGNPPCAAWSCNGKNVGANSENWRTDPRVECTRRHFNLLEELRPRAWAWESVPQALTKGKDFVDELAERAARMGYGVTFLLHDAQWLGVPQRRKRFFFVAHADKIHWQAPNWAPAPTPVEALSGIAPRGEPATDGEINNKMAPYFSQLAPGQRLYKLWESLNPEEQRVIGSRGQTVGRPSFGQVRLPRDVVGPATVGYAMVHPTEDRFCAVNELQALAGFPQSWEFVSESKTGEVRRGDADRIDLIARGVCPPVASWLARCVASSIGGATAEPVAQLVDLSMPPGQTKPLAAPRKEEKKMRTTTTTTTTIEDDVLEERAPPVPEVERPPVRDVRPKEGLRSGAYIRLLLSMGAHSPDQIAELVRKHYPTSKATVKDVAYHRYKMKRESVAVPEWRQPTRAGERLSNDPDRTFDKSSLRANSHGQWIHRDYGAHFFRWGFAGRFVSSETEVLDVGCGPDVPMVGVLTMPRSQVPKRYVGVDLNREPRKVPSRGWADLKWEFNFVERYQELGQFDLVTCFEMIEHMQKSDGECLLAGIRACLRPGGTALVSTPVYNGKAAADHLHEWGIDELAASIAGAGLRVESRRGTFASQNDIKKVATPEHLAVAKALSEYYSGEVVACFLAPLYPDASRNNVWVLKRENG